MLSTARNDSQYHNNDIPGGGGVGPRPPGRTSHLHRKEGDTHYHIHYHYQSQANNSDDLQQKQHPPYFDLVPEHFTKNGKTGIQWSRHSSPKTGGDFHLKWYRRKVTTEQKSKQRTPVRTTTEIDINSIKETPGTGGRKTMAESRRESKKTPGPGAVQRTPGGPRRNTPGTSNTARTTPISVENATGKTPGTVSAARKTPGTGAGRKKSDTSPGNTNSRTGTDTERKISAGTGARRKTAGLGVNTGKRTLRTGTGRTPITVTSAVRKTSRTPTRDGRKASSTASNARKTSRTGLSTGRMSRTGLGTGNNR